jgi:hypothetical protein
MFCPSCGKELDGNNICINTGCPSNSTITSEFEKETSNNYNQNPAYNQGNSFTDKNGVSANEMMDFFGPKNTEYYMDKWNKSQENPSFLSWNWPAFLFGWIWLCYRKLYVIAGILLAVSFIGNSLPGWAQSILTLGIMIGAGLLANQVYVKQSTDKIRSIKLTTGTNQEVLSQRLRATGGITWVPVIIALVLSALLVLFIIILVRAFGSAFSSYGNFSY